MTTITKSLFILPLLLIIFCVSAQSSRDFKTKHVVILVMDGARYSETWGDTTHRYIPQLANQLSQYGVVNVHFYNTGLTETTAGHTAMATGVNQTINNTGMELPQYPSLFQYWRKQCGADSTLAWIITTKDKLAVLANCKDSDWHNTYMPATDCGINGNGTGYREDSVTFKHTLNILTTFHPNLVLVNFKEPDASGHQNNWQNYVKGITSTDNYAYRIWEYLQTDPIYKGTTTVFITNDHGRHLDSIADGFVSHGCTCDGCKHIFLYAFGPDFKQNVIDETPRELIDIPATIAQLLHITMPTQKGTVMLELLK